MSVLTDTALIEQLAERLDIPRAEAARLLEALDKTDAKPSPRELKRKWIHIKVNKGTDENVDVRIPLALLKFGFRFAPKHMHMKLANGMSREHKERIRMIKRKAREAKARARAEAHARVRKDRGHSRGSGGGLKESLEQSINEAVDEAMTESFESMGEIFGDDFNLDLDRILQMAQDPSFDGKILEEVRVGEVEKLKPRIGAGMNRKLIMCAEAVKGGVGEAIISSGLIENPLSALEEDLGTRIRL